MALLHDSPPSKLVRLGRSHSPPLGKVKVDGKRAKISAAKVLQAHRYFVPSMRASVPKLALATSSHSCFQPCHHRCSPLMRFTMSWVRTPRRHTMLGPFHDLGPWTPQTWRWPRKVQCLQFARRQPHCHRNGCFQFGMCKAAAIFSPSPSRPPEHSAFSRDLRFLENEHSCPTSIIRWRWRARLDVPSHTS